MDVSYKDGRNKDIDWSRYGLGSEGSQRVRANTSGFVDLSNDYDYGAGGHQASGANELFAEEQVRLTTNRLVHTLITLFSLGRRTMVEIELLHITAGLIRHLGRRVHFLPNQHLRCDRILKIRLDCGPSGHL